MKTALSVLIVLALARESFAESPAEEKRVREVVP